MTKIKLYTPGTDSLRLFRPLLHAKTEVLRARGMFPEQFQGDFQRIGEDITNLIKKTERFFRDEAEEQ